MRIALMMLVLAGVSGTLQAQNLPVYGDALQSGFANYSYANAPAVLPDFASTAVVRTGSNAIAFTPRNFNAVAFAHETQTFTPAAYTGIRFFVNGGAGSGQELSINVYDSLGNVADSGPLASYVAGGAIAAGQWRQAEVLFAQAPIGYAGNFVRIDIQDGGDGSAQPTVYIDDVVLIAAAAANPNIFADGFEDGGVGPAQPGALRFTSTTFGAGEGAGSVLISVERVNGDDGAVGVAYGTANGTAIAPGDYASATGTLSWAEGEAGSKTFPVTIVDDDDDENSETVSLALSAPSGGATLAVPSTATLSIADDDDPAPVACGLTAERDVTVGAMTSDRFTWCDAAGTVRSAVLAHNDGQVGPTSAGGYTNRGGAMREYRFRMPGGAERVATVTTYGNAGYGGFGYVVSHASAPCGGDDSPLGYGTPGAFQRVWEGRHHAIFRFTQDYPRRCTPAGTVDPTTIPVTIDWTFSTGRDNPLWSITYDLNGFAANRFFDDSRAPYGEFNIDGDGFSHAISGTAWGDRFKFTTTSVPATLGSSWTYNQPNTIPYVKLWIVASDATMGIVQTQTIDQQDAGAGRKPMEYDLRNWWNETSAGNPAGPGYSMPDANYWAYQANAFNLGPASGSNNARLTWGTQYGFLGQASYFANNTLPAGGNVGSTPGHPSKSYSTFMVLDAHSRAPVEAQVTQVETAQTVTLNATTGSVVTSGPAGVADATTKTYAPAGYDHVYSALRFAAAGNQVAGNIAVGAGTLRKPLVIVSNWSAGLPSQVMFGGAALVQDVDYFPSVFAGRQELWITLNRNASGPANALQLVP